MGIESLIRPDILKMKAYESARSLVEVKEGLCFLDANELHLNDFSSYPSPQPEAMVNKLAKVYGVDRNQILITRGADEGIECVIRSSCPPGRSSIAVFEPTYDVYQNCALLHGAKTEHLKLTKNFQLDIISAHQAIDRGISCLFLCHPNNPTGNLLSENDIKEVIEYGKDQCLVVVDEAYIEFSKAKSVSRMIKQYSNLVVLRTLSKAYGLAGLRCGSILAQAQLIEQFRKTLAPYPIPTPVTQAFSTVELNFNPSAFLEEKKRVLKALVDNANVQTVFPTDSNFVLCQVKDVNAFYEYLLQKNILVRKREKKVPNGIRITIGTPSENDQLIAALAEMGSENG